MHRKDKKAKLLERYMHRIVKTEQLVNPKQDRMSIVVNKQKFDEFRTQCEAEVNDCQAFAPSKAGLRANIGQELLRDPLLNMEHGFQATLNIEKYLRYLITSKSDSQTKESIYMALNNETSQQKA